ncbi:MAG TPA: hypothetical protein VL984_04730 [Acidimicrobiales bacterium]|nr:hypothetical protein [Acidimicrobiales bacterium]
MSIAAWTVAAIFGGALLGFTTYAFIIGVVGAISGGRFERCPRCHRHGLAVSAPLHADGCPPLSFAERVRQAGAVWSRTLHLGHR